ncbi:hypothetical protein ACPXCP_39835 [Streptomyces sp. DT20]|uniref:hypothetical protein n=1 Tax=Streptomyces sp. DT20 TaxID=3416519 RepID=UPI003CF97E81
MSTDVADLLASIDDVLEAAPVPAPVSPVDPAEPVVAVEPVLPAEPAEAPADSLYEMPQVEAAVAAPVAGARVSAVPRLPYWWQKDKQRSGAPRVGRAEPADTADTVEAQQPQRKRACEHARLVVLMEERGGEALARLCLDCDERLPATDPEPDPECEHEQRLEARSESGKLVGYVCAVGRCGARLTVEEVHGRAGKWLRPAKTYYPRLRNPLSPAAPVDGQEAAKPALSAGTLRLLANAGAAGAGFLLGLVPMFGSWIEECGETSIGGALVLGGSITFVLTHFWDRHTRHWHPVLAWVARIPLASVITALALYAPASQI